MFKINGSYAGIVLDIVEAAVILSRSNPSILFSVYSKKIKEFKWKKWESYRWVISMPDLSKFYLHKDSSHKCVVEDRSSVFNPSKGKWSTRQLSQNLGVCQKTVNNWVLKGKLNACIYKNAYVIDADPLEPIISVKRIIKNTTRRMRRVSDKRN